MNKSLVIVLFVTMPLIMLAQQKPKYDNKVYASPEGRLYIQSELPVYLWLSTSPDESSKKHRLKSEENPQYSNPMYFDLEGYNTFRSPSAVDTVTRKTVTPLQDIIFEVYGDISAPKTSIDYGESKPYLSEGKLYVKNNTNITLNAKDKLSGVESIYYSIDGAVYTKYTKAIVFSEEREYTLKYYAVDNVGNDEEVSEIKFFYDKTSPVTSKKVLEEDYNSVLSAKSKIELSTEDKGIGAQKIKYSIDSGKEYTYQYALKAANLSQGEHTLNYYAIDKSGNKEAVKTYAFYVDKTPPTIIEEVIAKTFFANGKEYASGKAQLKLTAFDNKAGVKEIYYSINGGKYELYNKPVFLNALSGSLLIKTYAVDNVNNRSAGQTANQKTTIPYIDLSGPNLKHTYSGPIFNTRDTIFISKETKIKLRGYEQESGMNRIEYQIDGKEKVTYDGAFSIENEGVHQISYIGFDNVENTSSKSFSVKVDNTGPEIGYEFSTTSTGVSNGQKEYPKFVILFLTGSDNVVGLQNIKYGFGASTPTKIYTVPITGFSSGAKSVSLLATDKLGNTSEEVIKFSIKE